MDTPKAGFAAIYRWRLHPGMEDQFVEGWTRLSKLFLSEHGSLGSRLHRGPDGVWYSYSQWPSAMTRDDAFASGTLDKDAAQLMQAAIAESFPEISLEPVVSLLMPTQPSNT